MKKPSKKVSRKMAADFRVWSTTLNFGRVMSELDKPLKEITKQQKQRDVFSVEQLFQKY